MSRTLRWGGVVAAILGMIGLTSVLVLRSDWLRVRILATIIDETERVTGGRVELGGYRFDWPSRIVEITRFTLHGSETSGPPLLTVERATIELRIVSLFTRDVRLGKISATNPHAHLIIGENGTTNLPRPKGPKSGKRVADIIVDLKIAGLDTTGGTLLLEVAKQGARAVPWDAHALDVGAKVSYDPLADRYAGDVAVGRAKVSLLGRTVDASIEASASMERNRIGASRVKVTSATSEILLTEAGLENFAAPVTHGHFVARLGLAEIDKRTAGTIQATGEARWVSLDDYRVTGHAEGSDVSVPRVRHVQLAANFELTPQKLMFHQAKLAANGGRLVADGSLENWTNLRATGKLEAFDIARAASLAGIPTPPYGGAVSGPFEVRANASRQFALAKLAVTPAATGTPMRGQVEFQYDSAASRVELGHSWIELPATRVDVSGTLGERLEVRASSRNPAEVLGPLGDRAPKIGYAFASFDGSVVGPLGDPVVEGQVSATAIVFDGKRMDSLSGEVEARAGRVSSNSRIAAVNGMRITGKGSAPLADWALTAQTPIDATGAIEALDLTTLPEIQKLKLGIAGLLSAKAAVSGTVGAPVVAADVILGRGAIEGQPFDSISGKAQWANRDLQSFAGIFVSGTKRVNITAALGRGTDLEFNFTSNTMALNEIALVRARQPDIQGFGKFHADGLVKITTDSKGDSRADLARVRADASANGLELFGRNLGDARFTAQTNNGIVSTHFESNAAKASIRGDGTVRLGGEYVANAKIQFTESALNPLVALILKSEDAKSLNFDGTLEATLAVTGPLRRPEDITAVFDIPKVEVHPLAGTPVAKLLPGYSVVNDGPIRVSMAKSVAKVESAHLKAPQTDVSVTGTVSPFAPNTVLDLKVRGDLNLALLHTLSPDLTSSGVLTLDAIVRGGFTAPELSGRAVLRNGDFHYSEFSNGLSSANGEITFTGSRANIQSLSAESGGGRVQATGFASWSGDQIAFRVEAKGTEVRVRYPEGVSSVSDAAITLSGTQQRSQVSGTVTVHRIAVNPKSDAATILQLSAQPLKVAPQGGLLANMNLDVQVATAPDVAIQTSVTKSVSADANLRLRGTATNPAILGRVNITQGEVVFFGNKYDINQGTISFFNPTKIEPVLNLDLETKARGVDVILTVAGPMSKLNVSYRSDPPLQFSDIVALLATGRTPVDPTLSGQAQGYQQLGASELVGQAIANPVAGRLQRFFGVSRLKIDPQLTGLTGSPQARLTIEQQITPEILFTYITDVSNTNTQLFRVEWAFNKNWSAILTRQESGYVGIDFAYKKRFK